MSSSTPDFWQATPHASDPMRYTYTAPREACVGTEERHFFMGGACMAMVLAALERSLDKPLLWATTHFLSHGLHEEEFELDIEIVGGGKRVAQAMATVKRVNDNAIIQRSIAALGKREVETDKSFITAPQVPPPAECPIKPPDAFGKPDNLIGQFERRAAFSDEDAGLEYVWTRPNFPTQNSAAVLAMVSDFFLGAHPLSRGGTSLDNTLRICNTPKGAAGWILSTTQITNFYNGSISGTMNHFAEDGTLLATSSQTGLLPYNPNPLVTD